MLALTTTIISLIVRLLVTANGQEPLAPMELAQNQGPIQIVHPLSTIKLVVNIESAAPGPKAKEPMVLAPKSLLFN